MRQAVNRPVPGSSYKLKHKKNRWLPNGFRIYVTVITLSIPALLPI
jgi:hypothetical protein